MSGTERLPNALAAAARPQPRVVLLCSEPAEPVRAALAAKPLEWEPQGDHDYTDKHHGFYIAHQPDDEPDYRWSACWGEDDGQNFATLEEAKVWCQEQIDAWVRQYVVAPTDELATLRARLDDALQVLRMVDDNNRVDAGEWRKGWRHEFVVSEVRRVLGS